MPWATFKEGDEFCVYKLDAENEKSGETLGCHPSRDKAQAQVAALYAKEPKSLKDVLFSIAWLKDIFSPEDKAGARHRKEDQDALDNAHEALIKAGANCPGMMKVMKGKDGEYYAYGIVSNKFRDRDYAKHPKGEIITEAAHKEFIQFLDTHPDQAPELWSWHTPGSARKSRATWWEYSDGFLQMLWPLTEKEAKAFDSNEEIAMSHGFYTLARDSAKGHILKYRSFEGSDLPSNVAANPYTALEVMQKELGTMFTPEKREYLVKRLGADRVKELEGNTEAMGKALTEAGVEYKETTTEVKTETVVTPAAVAPVAAQSIVVDEKSIGALVESIKAALNIDGLQKVLTDIQAKQVEQSALIEALQKSDDVKVAETIAPKVKPMTWGFQASQSKETILTDAEKAQSKSSKPGWASEVFSGVNGQAH